MSSRAKSLDAVARAHWVAALFAMSPAAFGGVLVRAQQSQARDTWVERCRSLLRDDQCWRRVPVTVGKDRLLGGLDFAATLQSGLPQYSQGLLTESHGGVIELAMAERLDADRAAVIANVMDTREVAGQQPGANASHACHIGIVAMDEGLDEDEHLDDALADRMAFHIDDHDIGEAAAQAGPWSRAALARAQQALPEVAIGDDMISSIAATSAALGIPSVRGDLFAIRTAKAIAALSGRADVSAADAGLAAQLVIAHRARVLPQQADDTDATEPEPPPVDEMEPSERENSDSQQDSIDELVLQATRAAVPAKLLSAAIDYRRSRVVSAGRGRAGQLQKGRRTGRVVGAVAADRVRDGRLNLLATMRAALPWQALRRTDGDPSRRLIFAKSDLQVSRHKDRNESTTIFVVDASGSQAAQRLGEVKGAIELLIAECYVRRDQVALVSFRGKDADVLLAPTRALARAKRALAELPGGGGTPLAAGIDKAAVLVDVIRRQGRTPQVVFLTDGRANVSRDGSEGHQNATAEALEAARLFRATGLRPIVIDTSRRPRPAAREFSDALAGAYVALPHANAASINAVVSGATRS